MAMVLWALREPHHSAAFISRPGPQRLCSLVFKTLQNLGSGQADPSRVAEKYWDGLRGLLIILPGLPWVCLCSLYLPPTSFSVLVNKECQLDSIQHHLGDKPLSVREFLDWVTETQT